MEVVQMNIFLETTINQDIQNCYKAMENINENMNKAYLQEDFLGLLKYEKELAHVIKNTFEISKFIREH